MRQIGALLERVTEDDPDVWALFLQPDAELDDVCSFEQTTVAGKVPGLNKLPPRLRPLVACRTSRSCFPLPEDKRIQGPRSRHRRGCIRQKHL